MESLPVRVGCLYAGDRTDEQIAAHEWCRAHTQAATPLSMETIAEHDLSAYDLLWWHRDEPVEASVASAASAGADTLRSYIENGGGMLLSLQALAAVTSLGIDPIEPDVTGYEQIDHPTGFAPKAVHSEHPIFEGFIDWFYTLPDREHHPVARYESIVPAHGQILGSAIHASDLLPGHKEIISWSIGDGSVYGVGARIEFADVTAGGYRIERDQFVRNLLTTLGGERRPTLTDRPVTETELTRLRSTLENDHQRPSYHLTPPANWINDPNGIIHYNGEYHVFYQYNPAGPFHGTIHWGHARSEDLCTWIVEPVALSPDPDGPDRDGCWSGCAVIDTDGTPTIIYTGGRGSEQLPCLATATDETLNSWEKDPGNPIISSVPTEPEILGTADWSAEFRDHNVWREDGWWYHLIGAGLQDGGGVVLLYRGETLSEWEYVGPLLSGDYEVPHTVWECPEYLDLGEKDLLHISNYRDVRYVVGEIDLTAPAFTVENEGLLDYGSFYAPQSTTTPDGRVLMWGWIKENRPVEAQWNAGWSGALSIPRELSIGSDGELIQRPARKIADLREELLVARTDTLEAGDRQQLPLTGNVYEIDVTLSRSDSESVFELGCFESPALSEQTRIRWRDDDVVVDRSNATHDPAPETDAVRLPVDQNDELSLRIFIDGSILTVFANDRQCLTTRVYPTRSDADGVSVAVREGTVSIEASAWTLASSYDR